MSRLVERLAELRRHLDHLRGLRPRVTDAETLRRDLSLHNDVLYSLSDFTREDFNPCDINTWFLPEVTTLNYTCGDEAEPQSRSASRKRLSTV